MSMPSLPELSCGFPSPAGDALEGRPSLDQFFNIQAPSVFLFKAVGNSMAPLINPGDIVIIDRAKSPLNGSIVLAICYSNFTLKRLSKSGDQVELIAENPEYPPLLMKEEMNFEIWGVATGLMRAL